MTALPPSAGRRRLTIVGNTPVTSATGRPSQNLRAPFAGLSPPPSDATTHDRRGHPASGDQIGLVQRSTARPLSFGALREIIGDLASALTPLSFIGQEDGPRSARLLTTSFYDIWLVTWPGGSSLDAHDHGDVRSVLQVVNGELHEVVSNRLTATAPVSRILREGSSTAARSSIIHQLINRSKDEVTTLHGYSPPLSDVTFFERVAGVSCEPLRSAKVAMATPRSSSQRPLASRPRALSLVRP